VNDFPQDGEGIANLTQRLLPLIFFAVKTDQQRIAKRS
jgi:hypothetical protein